MKNRLGFIAFILLISLCLGACNNEESNNYEKQKEEPVAEDSEKTKGEEKEEETVETVAAEKTGDNKGGFNEQIQAFLDAYFELERIAEQEFPMDKGKIEDYYKLFSWWSNATADVKEDWLENKSNNASNAEIKTKTTSNLVGILKNTEVSETGEIITEILIDVAIHGVDEKGEINNTYTDIHHANVMLIPTENEYGWSVYNYNRLTQ